MPYGLSKTANSDGKSGTRSARSNMPDSSPLSNGMEGAQFWGSLIKKKKINHINNKTSCVRDS